MVPMSRPSSTGAAGTLGKIALRLDQRLAHRGQRRDDGGRLAHLARAQPRLVEIDQRQAARRRDRGLDIAERAAPIEKSGRRRPVEKPGIKMRQGVAAGKPARERAFA